MTMMMRHHAGGLVAAAVVALTALVVVMGAPAAGAAAEVDGVATLRLHNSSCLTPKQDNELRHAIAGIQITLSATVTALDIAAAAEKNPKTKHDLEEAATVISSVNKYLVSNLTQIVDSACGNCSQIVRVVNESAQAIEQSISHIDPALKNTTTWKLITTAIDDILAIVEIVCPSRDLRLLAPRPGAPRDDPCLNSTQIALFKKVIAGIQTVLTATDVALDIAAASEKDPKTKKDLQEAAKVIKAIQVELIGNLTKMAESPCATCTEIVNLVQKFTHALEDTLKDINPDWAKDPLWKSIVEAIDEIFGYVKVLCPGHAGHATPSSRHHPRRLPASMRR